MILLRLNASGVELHDPNGTQLITGTRVLRIGYSSDPLPTESEELTYPAWGLQTMVRCSPSRVEVLLDHAGAYPLYHAQSGNEIWLGTDAWQVAKYARLSQLDAAACMELLAYEFVIGPKTLVHGLSELQPATLATFKSGNGQWTRSDERRWSFNYFGSRQGTANELASVAADNLRQICAPIQKIAQQAHAPLALNLSGGWDSRAVLACLYGAGPAHLFTCTYGDPKFGGVKAAQAASAAVHIPNRLYPFESGTILREWFLTLCRKLPPVIRFNLADGGYAVSHKLYGETCGTACGHSGDFFTATPVFPAARIQSAEDGVGWLRKNMRSTFTRQQLRAVLAGKNANLADAPDDDLAQTARAVFEPGITGIQRWKLEQRVRRAAIVELRVLERATPVIYAPMLHREFIEFWASIPEEFLRGQMLYKQMLAQHLFTGAASKLASIPREGGGLVSDYSALGRWKSFIRKKAWGAARRVVPEIANRATSADPTVVWWRNDLALREWAWATLQKSAIIHELFDMGALEQLVLTESLSDYPMARTGIWSLLTIAGAEQVLAEK